MDTLHKHNYELASAVSSLVPSTGPVLCRDEMEEWSASEANLFEEALDKYGKDFNDIRQDFVSLPFIPPKTPLNEIIRRSCLNFSFCYLNLLSLKPNLTKPNSTL